MWRLWFEKKNKYFEKKRKNHFLIFFQEQDVAEFESKILGLQQELNVVRTNVDEAFVKVEEQKEKFDEIENECERLVEEMAPYKVRNFAI